MTEAKKRPPAWVIVLLVLVFGPIAVAVVRGIAKGASTPAPAPVVTTAQPPAKDVSAEDHALQAAAFEAVTLKQSMKDPKAFELVSLVVAPSGAGCFTYRSTNGFGAHMQSQAVLTPGGNMLLKERSPSPFAAAWNKDCASGDGRDIAPYLATHHVLD